MNKKTDFRMSARKLFVFLLIFLLLVTLGTIFIISLGKLGAKIFQIDIYLATFITFAVTCGVFGLLILNTISCDISRIREHFVREEERYDYEEDEEDETYELDDSPPICPSCGEKMVKVDDGDVHSHDEFNPYSNVGRNDPCPCGSGKKYKKCCGR